MASTNTTTRQTLFAHLLSVTHNFPLPPSLVRDDSLSVDNHPVSSTSQNAHDFFTKAISESSIQQHPDHALPQDLEKGEDDASPNLPSYPYSRPSPSAEPHEHLPSSSPSLDWESFRRECFYGIPDSPISLRPVCWKLLLNLLPWTPLSQCFQENQPKPNISTTSANEPISSVQAVREAWRKHSFEQRSSYYSFVSDIRPPTNEEAQIITNHHGSPVESSAPLPSGAFMSENIQILEQIESDVLRTAPDFTFFQKLIPHPPFSLSNEEVNQSTSPLNQNHAPSLPHSQYTSIWPKEPYNIFRYAPRRAEGEDEFRIHSIHTPETFLPARPYQEQHWEALERVLYIFAKLNPGIGYVQGMNEILTPLYYVFANDIDPFESAHAEADSFFALSAIMSVIRDLFIKTLDNIKPQRHASNPDALHQIGGSMNSLSYSIRSTEMNNYAGYSPADALYANGIGDSMERLLSRLLTRDKEVWKCFGVQQIHPAFFAFRWFTTLFTREFTFPDVLRIWDALLADLSIDLTNKEPDPVYHVMQEQPEMARSASNPDHIFREGKFDFVIEFGTAMLITKRKQIVQSDSMQRTLELLMDYTTTDVDAIFSHVYPKQSAPDLHFHPSPRVKTSASSPSFLKGLFFPKWKASTPTFTSDDDDEGSGGNPRGPFQGWKMSPKKSSTVHASSSSVFLSNVNVSDTSGQGNGVAAGRRRSFIPFFGGGMMTATSMMTEETKPTLRMLGHASERDISLTSLKGFRFPDSRNSVTGEGLSVEGAIEAAAVTAVGYAVDGDASDESSESTSADGPRRDELLVATDIVLLTS